MSKYRVVKVDLENHGMKFMPQKEKVKIITKSKKKKLKKSDWSQLHSMVNGTDIWVPCYYDTEEEAWDRIEKDKMSYKLHDCKYTIIDETI